MKNFTKKSATIVTIVILVIVLIAGIIYFKASKSFQQSSQSDQDTNSATKQTDSKQTSSSKTLPRNDIPIYPEGVVRYVINTDTGFSAGIKLSSDIDSKKVLQYYLDELPNNGWELEDNNVFISLTIKAHKDNKNLSIIMASAVDKEGFWTYVIEIK